MAHAATSAAPSKVKGQTEDEKYALEKEYLDKEFDPSFKYMWYLAEEVPQRELPVIDMVNHRPIPHKKYKPFQNIVFTSQIIWKGQRRMIRYYDGCTSLFVDEQPKDKDTIDQLIKQNKPRHFLDGKFGAMGDERMLILYMMICSWNTDSPFRTRSANSIFVNANNEKKANAELAKLDKAEEALKLAKDASEKKMKIHAAYLGISFVDWDSDNELTTDQIRLEYRKVALVDPIKFISSYDDKTIELKYWIQEALKSGTITNKLNPNKASWATGREICDISGFKSLDAIADRLLEFSQLEEGQEFIVQLKALYS